MFIKLKYNMTGSLNTQSARAIRYEKRCLKEIYNQQKKDRTMRLEKRNELKESISSEVSLHILNASYPEKKLSTRSTKYTNTFFNFF